MALINCPECNNQVSDKAVTCIHCGFPLSKYLNEIEKRCIDETTKAIEEDSIIAEFLDGYSIIYVNGKIKVLRNENVLYDGDIKDIKIYEVKKTFFSDGYMALYIYGTDIPRTLYCVDKESFAQCEKIKASCDSKKVLKKKDKPAFKGIYKFDLLGNATEVYCSNCGSSNCSNYKDEIIIPAKTKKSVSVNLNPLKPFTVLNVNEKTVRQERSISIEKFICNDCGKVFQ